MLRLSDVPGVHLVPAAIGMAADHDPEAQRWNEEPSLEQAYAPSSLHAPLWEPVVVELVEAEPLADTVAEEEVAAAAEDSGTGETATEVSAEPEVMAVAVAAGDEADEADEAAPVAKPPLADDVAAEAASVADDAATTALEVPSDEDDEPDDELELAAALDPLQPTGGPRFAFAPISTELPGSGYLMSIPSVVVQPSETPARLATKRSGKVVARCSRRGAPRLLEVPPVIVAGPQFM